MDRRIAGLLKSILFWSPIKNKLEIVGKLYNLEEHKRKLEKMLQISPANVLDLEENMTMNDCDALVDLAKVVAVPEMMVAEIGSWKGKSASLLGNVTKAYNGHVLAVDHWRGSKGAWNEDVAKAYDVFTVFRNNMKLLELEGVVLAMVMCSHAASKLIKDESLSLVFIDGDHRYSGFSQDLVDWLPKVKEGGIICGHDCERYYTRLSDKEKKMVEKNLENDYVPDLGHAGIIKALYEQFGDKYIRKPNSVIWYLQR